MFRDVSTCNGCEVSSTILPELSDIVGKCIETHYPHFSHAHFSKFTHLKQVGKAIRDKIMDTPFQKDFEEELKDTQT